MALLRLPRSIYSRTMLLVGLVTFLLQLTTFFIFFNQMVLPNVRIQVGQFVDSLELAAEQPELLAETAFVVPSGPLQLQPARWRIPFWHFVEEALEARVGVPVPMWEEQGGPLGSVEHYWIDLPRAEREPLRIGFSADRKGCLNPPVLLLVLFLVVSVSVVSVYFLSRWLVRPIEELRMAVGELGMGEYPEPLPERGPAELSSLVQLFNWMVKSVQSLTENRSTLLAGISHDLKTPLARMRLSVEMMDAEKDRDLLEGVVEDLDVMDGMISEVLEYARGAREGKKAESDLNQLIAGVVERKQRGGAEIEWSPSSAPCLYYIDRSALRRILSNFIDNANRYSAGALITVSLHCDLGRARIDVIDRGAGIPQEALEKVFQPFYRLEQSRSMDSGGNGLGLAIVKSLASANGWLVSLNNRAEGGILARIEIL